MLQRNYKEGMAWESREPSTAYSTGLGTPFSDCCNVTVGLWFTQLTIPLKLVEEPHTLSPYCFLLFQSPFVLLYLFSGILEVPFLLISLLALYLQISPRWITEEWRKTAVLEGRVTCKITKFFTPLRRTILWSVSLGHLSLYELNSRREKKEF